MWGNRIATNELLTFDGATGAVTSTVLMNSPDKMVSLAFDAVTGRLYGNTSAGFGAPFEALYEIDPATGVTTFIGPILFEYDFAPSPPIPGRAVASGVALPRASVSEILTCGAADSAIRGPFGPPSR